MRSRVSVIRQTSTPKAPPVKAEAPSSKKPSAKPAAPSSGSTAPKNEENA